jgi:hypothetical protein
MASNIVLMVFLISSLSVWQNAFADMVRISVRMNSFFMLRLLVDAI